MHYYYVSYLYVCENYQATKVAKRGFALSIRSAKSMMNEHEVLKYVSNFRSCYFTLYKGHGTVTSHLQCDQF